jgi:hypothetical protein
MKIRPVRTESFHADGRTDMTELIATFRNYANLPKHDGLIANSRESATVIYSESKESNPHPFQYYFPFCALWFRVVSLLQALLSFAHSLQNSSSSPRLANFVIFFSIFGILSAFCRHVELLCFTFRNVLQCGAVFRYFNVFS